MSCFAPSLNLPRLHPFPTAASIPTLERLRLTTDLRTLALEKPTQVGGYPMTAIGDLARHCRSARDVDEELERAARYRSRAEKLRLLAQNIDAQAIRRALLSVAEEYEDMAAIIEAAEAKTSRTQTRQP